MARSGEFVIEHGPERGRGLSLPPGRGIIGSDPRAAHVVLRDPDIAPGHLAVDVRATGQVTVWPLDGPVTVDGADVRQPVLLQPGSRVRVGGTTLAVTELPDMSAPARRGWLVAISVLLVLAGLLLVGGVWAATGVAGTAAAISAAVLPAPLLVALVLAIDRYEPEPRRVLAVTFAYGATAAVLLAGILNVAGFTFAAIAFGPQIGEFLTISVVAPVVEEILKGLAVLVVFWRLREQFNGVVDAIVYSAMVGLGFAVTENVFYYAEALLEGQDVFTVVIVLRGVMSPFAHPLFTSMFGIGLALASESARLRALPPLIGLAGAIALHALWNASTFLGPGFFLLYVILFVPIFLAVVVAAVLASRREARLIRTYLIPEIQRGMLTAEEVAKLASVRLRRAAERDAVRAGGESAKEARRAFHHAATRLAFLRHRRSKNAMHAPTPDEEARWVAEVRRRKALAKHVPVM